MENEQRVSPDSVCSQWFQELNELGRGGVLDDLWEMCCCRHPLAASASINPLAQEELDKPVASVVLFSVCDGFVHF